MNMTPIEIQGTLREDGTLLLDQKPNLPAGRVKVIVRPVVDPSQTGMHRFFERIEKERRAQGVKPHSAEEIDTYLATMRDDDDRCLAVEKAQHECQRHRGQQQQGAE